MSQIINRFEDSEIVVGRTTSELNEIERVSDQERCSMIKLKFPLLSDTEVDDESIRRQQATVMTYADNRVREDLLFYGKVYELKKGRTRAEAKKVLEEIAWEEAKKNKITVEPDENRAPCYSFLESDDDGLSDSCGDDKDRRDSQAGP